MLDKVLYNILAVVTKCKIKGCIVHLQQKRQVATGEPRPIAEFLCKRNLINRESVGSDCVFV